MTLAFRETFLRCRRKHKSGLLGVNLDVLVHLTVVLAGFPTYRLCATGEVFNVKA